MKSLWKETAGLPRFSALEKSINADVLIIGGGFAGLLTAFLLKEQGAEVVLVTQGRICDGVTANTTAKITAQHGLVYNKIIDKYGADCARLYYLANKKAIDEFEKLSGQVECDFERTDSFVFALQDLATLQKEQSALSQIGVKSEMVKSIPLPFKTAGAIKITNQAQFHPLKFARIFEGLPVYENTKINKISAGKCYFDKGVIRAQKIVVATHFPIYNLRGLYSLKMYQERSYVVALEGAKKINGMYLEEGDNLSVRGYGDLVLLGGKSHRTGTGGGYDSLLALSKKLYPGSTPKYMWATQDCITLDDIPYIGEYYSGAENLYVATGFNKWGMTSSMVSAMILRDLLQGAHNEFAKVFSPSRSVFHPQLAENIFSSVKGILTPTVPRCTHLGCALKWNKAEHTWDCPCHGSRFTEDGRVICNPANKDKTHT